MRRYLLLVLVATSAAFLTAEGLLRLQQALGPFYDLEFQSFGSLPSDELNHVHAAREDWVLRDPAVYGDHAGHRYTVRYDDHGVRLDRYRREPATAPRVLLLGDSFVEGYDDDNTLSAHVWRTLANTPRAARVFNAGASSYAPSIYTLQAKRLVPAVQPDLVVVVIDETDLGDDHLRYRDLAVRDAAGALVAVRSSPALRDFVGGFLEIKQSRHTFYVVRFARRLYHARLRPRTQTARAALDAVDPLVFARRSDHPLADEARRTLSHHLDELITTLVQLVGAPRVLLVTHPHLEQLQPAATRWTPQVASLVAQAATRHGVAYWDATDSLRQAFGADPAAYYWRGDMHFNFDGLRLYGEALAAVVARQLGTAPH